jgi:hypothetical protein
LIGLLLSLAVLAALISVGLRSWQRRREARRRPGATIHRPLAVSRFDEIDLAVWERRCSCGGAYTPTGETSRSLAERRFRIVRLICNECEREEFVHFDVTAALH